MNSRKIQLGVVMAGLSVLAACSTPAPPPAAPPAPPPPPPVVIPPKPTPPDGSTTGLIIPAIGPDGVRHTILVDAVDAQKVWNLRSAFNVAALSCNGPQNAEITDSYRLFLKKQARALGVANRAVDTVFRKRYGKAYVREREAYLTQLYNYFAYPPTLPAFCASALEMSRQSAGVSAKELPDFASRSFVKFTAVYEDFYRAYEKYRVDLANWEAKYGAKASSPIASAAPVPVVGGGEGKGGPVPK